MEAAIQAVFIGGFLGLQAWSLYALVEMKVAVARIETKLEKVKR